MQPLAFEKVKERDDMDRPEWQKLGMESADEYLAREQSGLTLEQWREKYDQVSWSESQSGLLGTRVIRPVVGLGWYSHELVYDGMYLLDSADLEWQASRAWHGREAGLGPELAYGSGWACPIVGRPARSLRWRRTLLTKPWREMIGMRLNRHYHRLLLRAWPRIWK